MFKILRNIKNIFVHVRSTLKFIFLVMIATIIIIGIISLVYKPMYSVSLNGEFIGYTTNKSKLQNRINEYIENGNGTNIAFIDVQSLPEYSLCLLKKENKTNDDEIFELVKNQGTVYYKYYAIVEDTAEKYYVSTKEEAEDIINKLKEKKSTNINDIAYTQIHSTELKEFSDTEAVISELYVKPKVVIASTSAYSAYRGEKIISTETPSSEVLGIGLIKPVYGTITSRYGERWGNTHTGLDIAAPTGTTIAAAAAGTVTFSGSNGGGLGYFIKISHGNGVETVYAHCSQLYVKEGQTVAQGEAIAAVGSTGNSTGPHLHLEIRLNGTAQNPQLYLYK
ncbi:MAG: M23 family metallopeptidase [Clostridia bacterium]|nr:M23 family metallopeptidase [Clostridia bacterium]